MFRKLLILSLLVLSFGYGAQAQNLTISGSNGHSVMICANGNIFTWGINNLNQLGAEYPGTAAFSDPYITTPARVGDIGEIFQVDAGSGGHTLAMTCEGKVYAWGSNETSQLGNTNLPLTGIHTPTLVQAGDTDPTNSSGDLENVVFVSGGNDESFAIWEDPSSGTRYAISWGQNDEGQLGDGTTIDRSRPVFVMNGITGAPLEDVVMVEAGDENGVALTADGRVWTWGKTQNSFLGRDFGTTSLAFPVETNNTTGAQLSGIVQISAGDRHVLALDGNGNVWAWGGGWMGQVQSTGGDVNQATLIAAGAEFIAENPGAVNLGDGDPVTSIAAGQAYSAFATASGRAYAMGMNGFYDAGGTAITTGLLANGCTIANSIVTNPSGGNVTMPLSMKTGPGTPIENVIGVSDGDGWSFVITTDGIYVAGYNAQGQLGIGSTTDACWLTPLPDVGCDLTTPCPEISLGPDFLECPGFIRTLSAGVIHPYFTAILYHDGVYVDSLYIDPSQNPQEVTFDVSDFGTYMIEIHDRRPETERPCDPCDMVWDDVVISPFQPTMIEPDPKLTFCGGSGWDGLHVDFTSAADPVNNTYTFGWYATQTGGTRLATSIDEGDIDTPIDTLDLGPVTEDSVYTVWVEDESITHGYAGYRTPCPIGTGYATGATEFYAYNDFVLQSIDLVLDGSNNDMTYDFSVELYSSTTNNGNDVPDVTAGSIAQWDTTFSRYVTRDANNQVIPLEDTLITANLNFDIEGSSSGRKYWLGIYTGTNVPLWYTCTFPTGADLVEDSGLGLMELVTTVQNASNASTDNGFFFNWHVTAGSQYPCGRVPVTVTRRCPPCIPPSGVDITVVDNGDISDSTLCPGESLQLTTGTQSSDTTWEFLWFRNTISNGTELQQDASDQSSFTVTYANAGTYIVLVRDKNKPTSEACWETDTIVIGAAVDPTYTITGGAQVCDSNDLEDVVITLTAGTGPWNVTYSTDGTIEGTTTSTSTIRTDISTDTVRIVPPYSVHNLDYEVTAISDQYCFGTPAPAEIGESQLKLMPYIEIINTGDSLEFCGTDGEILYAEHLDPTAIAASGQTPVYSWITGSSTNRQLAVTAEGDYQVIADLNGCVDTSDIVRVTQYDNPTVTLPNDTTYCFGDNHNDIDITLTTGDPDFTVYYSRGATDTIATSATAIASIVNPAAATYCVDSVIDVNGCISEYSNLCTIIDEEDSIAVVTSPVSICTDITNADISAMIVSQPSVGSGQFISVDPSTASVTSDGTSFIHAGAGNYLVTYQFTNATGCTADFIDTVYVNDTLAPQIIPDTLEVCAGDELELSTGEFATYSWTGDAASYLGGATSVRNPTFTAPITAGDYPIVISVEDIIGCAGSGRGIITVHPVPTAYFEPHDSVCTEGGVVTVVATPSVSGGTGVYSISGTGVIDATTGEFDPLASGAGTYTITFNYTNPASEGSCVLDPAIDTTITVNPKPVISIDYAGDEEIDLCIDNDSIILDLSHPEEDAILTVEPASGNAGLYTSATVVRFDPRLVPAGDYNVIYNYTDDNDCVADADTLVIHVHALPVVDITMNPDEVCNYTSSFALQAELADGTDIATSGTFSGSGITAGQFDPPNNINSEVTRIFTFNYTDPVTGCQAVEAVDSIIVNYTPPMRDTTYNSLNRDITGQADIIPFCPVGTDITWYGVDDTTSSVLDEAACYSITYDEDPLTGFMSALNSPYIVYASQILNGCKSVPARYTYNVSDCPAPAPVAPVFYACAGDAAREISATAAGGTAATLGWWSSEPSNPTIGDEEFLGDAWSAHGFTESHVFYVAEWDPDSTCYGPLTQVRLEVMGLPDITIYDLDTTICSTVNNVTFNYDPTGTMTGTGLTGNNWSPVFDNTLTGEYITPLTINVEEVHGTVDTASATCLNDSTFNMHVTHVLAPTGSGIQPNDPVVTGKEVVATMLPDMVINYYSGATVSVIDSINVEIATETELDAGFNLYQDGGHIADGVAGDYFYDVTQTLNECTSPVAVSEWNVVDCPTPAPVIDDRDTCFGVGNPEVNFTSGNNPLWYVITATDTTEFTTIAGNSTFIPADLGYTDPGVYTFGVSQTLENPYTSLQCRGPIGDFTLTIHELPVFEFMPNDTACYDGVDIQVDIDETYGSTITSTVFTLNPGVGEISLASSSATRTFVDPTTGINTYGLHPMVIQAVTSDANGCEYTNDTTIYVQYTEPPVIDEDANGYGYTHVQDELDETTMAVLNATVAGSGSTNVNWYRQRLLPAFRQTYVGENLTTTDGVTDVTNPDITYYATNTEYGCVSVADTTLVHIFECPVLAPQIDDIQLCQYDDVPFLEATENPLFTTASGDYEMRWYEDATRTTDDVLLGTGLYQHNIPTALDGMLNVVSGGYQFYVAEYDNVHACEGPRTLVTIDVHGTAPITINGQPNVCRNEDMPEFNVSTSFDVHWYLQQPDMLDPAALTADSQDNPYTPAMPATAGPLTVYAMSHDGDCFSRPASATIEVKPIPAAPTVQDLEFCDYDVVGQILQATSVPTGGTVKWYETDLLASYIRDERIILDATSAGTYYARTELNGCISDAYETAEVIIIEQPTQLFVEDVPSCSYDYATTSEFEFIPNGSNTVSVYEDNDVSFSTPLAMTGNRFTAPQTTGSNSYVAIQYTPVSTMGTVCASDPFTFTYQLYPVVDVPTTINVAAECYMDTDPVYARMAVSTDHSDGYIWMDQFYNEIGTGRRINFPVADVTADGTYTYYVKAYDEYVFNGNDVMCYDDPRAYTRTFLETPPTPVIADDPFCFEEYLSTAPNSRKVRATGTSNYAIVWMSAGGEIVDNNPDPLYYLDNDGDRILDHDTITLYPGQSKEILAYAVTGNCYSVVPAEVNLEIRSIPRYIHPQIETLCFGQDTIEPIVAMPYDVFSTFTWYQARIMTPDELLEMQIEGIDEDIIVDGDTVYFEQLFEEGPVFHPTGIDQTDTTYLFKVYLRDSYGCLSDTASPRLYSAPIPETKIVGNTKVCVPSSKLIYRVDEVSLENSYEWIHYGTDRTIYLEGESKQLFRMNIDTVGIDFITVTETTPYGCYARDTLTVTSADPPTADFDWEFPGALLSATFENLTIQDTLLSVIDTALLPDEFEPRLAEVDTLPITYTSYWFYGRDQDVFPSVHSYEQKNRIDTVRYTNGPYEVILQVKNDHGCSDEISYGIDVKISHGLFIPNAFSPSSSAHAVREFLPKGFNLATYELSIFDSWGNMLFFSDELTPDGRPAQGWDGTYEGVPLKSDTYIWKIKATYKDGIPWDGVKGNKKDYGNVVLIR